MRIFVFYAYNKYTNAKTSVEVVRGSDCDLFKYMQKFRAEIEDDQHTAQMQFVKKV